MTLFYLLHSEKFYKFKTMKALSPKLMEKITFSWTSFLILKRSDKNQFKTSLNKKIKLFTKNNNILYTIK